MPPFKAKRTGVSWIKARAGWVILFLLIPFRLLALDPARDISQYSCQSWNRQGRLPANGINAITQTRDGYLWLGTQMGIVRFDGVDFKLFNLPEIPQFRTQMISALAASRDGGFWFGIRNGSLGFHDKRGNFSPISAAWAEAGMNVLSLRETGDGAVWMGTGNGTARWIVGNTNQSQFFENLPNVSVIYQDSGNRVWLGTADRGLFYWQDGKIIPFPDPVFKTEGVFAIAEDSLGRIWVGNKVGLRCYNPDFHPAAISPTYTEVRALLVDRHGVLWVGTSGDGLACYKNGTFSFLKKADGLAGDYVTALCEDQEGSLWVGTRNGLSQLTDVKLPVFSVSEGILPGAYHDASASASGGLWAAASFGITYFDGVNATNWTSTNGLSNSYTKRIFEAKNGDVYLINGNKDIQILSGGKIIATYPNTNWPTAFAEDSSGVVASVAGYLFRVGRDYFVPYTYDTTNTPPFYWIRNLFGCKNGSILVASVNGVFRIKNGAWQRWTVENGLSDYNVLWVSQDEQGTIWAGLTTGISRIKENKITNITRENGLLDNFVSAMIPDNHGSMWINSSRGIFRVSARSLNDFADGKTSRVECEAFNGQEAVKTIDTTEAEYTACKTADGRIWIPCPQGLVMIDPSHLIENTEPPPVHIQQVRANGVELRRDGTHPRIRPGKGELEFRFSAPSFISPQKEKFRYQLEGYDAEWVDAGDRRVALYANLKPGEYRFHVQAANADGVWNTAGDSMSVVLPPYFHQTLWFRILCALAALGVLLGLYGWRTRHLQLRQVKLREANELLESKVRARTSELASANVALQQEIENHKRAQMQLNLEIEHRRQIELEVEKSHKQLVVASRRAGMAEVATSVLHNVGNVLNSVNVSASIVEEKVKNSSAAKLDRVLSLLREHEGDLAGFLSRDPRGKQVVAFLEAIATHLDAEKGAVLNEIAALARNVDHIKSVVAMQQTHARVGGVSEIVNLRELIEDAISLHKLGYERHGITLTRDFAEIPPIILDRHKVLQIVVNLLQNAKHACTESGRRDREVVVRIGPVTAGKIKVEVRDNGVGISPQNLTRIFSHGFTTRKTGHGFGLHSGALAAKEMDGSLTAQSEGPGKGAIFILELSAKLAEMGHAAN
ncbi:MAG TPA: two-component regulator propeller domain-containing protein [Verrucomicrobiae bacterium]|nr:two-component regulator propeller domain-containing protein [Verrucomicrobiae bacterium]